MRALIQRVARASVSIDGGEISRIGPGLLILLGVEDPDAAGDADWLSRKIARMRIFPDATGRMNLALADRPDPEALVVSQFTLHASTRRGNRPSFLRAAAPGHSEPLYEHFCAALGRELGRPVATGRFGAAMRVDLVNDGPVTVFLDSKAPE